MIMRISNNLKCANQQFLEFEKFCHMSDEQDTIIEDQPLKVLGLFHKRQLGAIDFDEGKFLKLYDSLCCTICRQLFNKPVYLRCSHRFCKECIEKYIRINQKRSCPNCRGGLTTKRDLREDYGLSTLINYAFGDRNRFCDEVEQIQNAEAVTLQRTNSKASSIVRAKSFVEQQQKSLRKKIKVNQENVPIQDSEKIQKSEGEVKIKKKRGRPFCINKVQDAQKTGQFRIEINSLRNINELSVKVQASLSAKNVPTEEHSFKQNRQQNAENNLQSDIARSLVRKKRGRKKNIPIIYVKSHSSEQINEQANIDRQAISNNIELQVQNQSGRKSARQTIQKRQKQLDKFYYDAETKCDLYQKEKKCLKEQLGSDYMFKLMKIPTLDFLIQVKLEKHPNCVFTPVLACKSIQVSTKARLHNVFILIAKLMNCSIVNVDLFTKKQKIVQLAYEQYKSKSLGQINQDLWKTVGDVQVFDMKQILSSLQDIRGQNNHHKGGQNQQTYKPCKLFQGMQVQKEHRLTPGRKRGRSRSKRVEEKENIEIKEQFKRIFYYKLRLQKA